MKKFNPFTMLIVIVIAFFSVTFIFLSDANKARITRFNNETLIQCYSGSKEPVFTDKSTGMVETSQSGNGLYYRSKTTGKLVQLYLDCVVFEEN